MGFEGEKKRRTWRKIVERSQEPATDSQLNSPLTTAPVIHFQVTVHIHFGYIGTIDTRPLCWWTRKRLKFRVTIRWLLQKTSGFDNELQVIATISQTTSFIAA